MRTIALIAASLLVSAAAWACPACYGAGDNTPITNGMTYAVLGMLAITGVMLFCSEAARLYPSTTFRLKLAFLVVAGINALAFELRERRQGLVAADGFVLPTYAKVAGWVSLLAWMLVIVFGRWTAYGL